MEIAIVSLISNALLSLIKRIPSINSADDTTKTVVLRLILGLLSLVGIIATSKITNAPIDPASVQTFVMALVSFLMSHGIFDLLKRFAGTKPIATAIESTK